jgi:hypothetical protein
MKKNANISELCYQLGEDVSKLLPNVDALVRFFEYVKGLTFEQTPDYDFIRKIFK